MADRTCVPGQPVARIDPVAYLAHAAAVVREHGFVSAGETEGVPTWREALARMDANGMLTPADLQRAHEILGWARALKPRRSDSYRSRLAGCLVSEQLSTSDLPLAASAVRAFNRHLYYKIRGRRSRSARDEHPTAGGVVA